MFDDYFHHSPTNCSIYEFSDGEAKQDFVEWLQEEGCMEQLSIIKEGWGSKEEKVRHQRKEKAKPSQERLRAQLETSILLLEQRIREGKCSSQRQAETKLERMKNKLLE